MDHATHYDWLIHTQPREAGVRPLFAAGAGLWNFRGTGAERSCQPLSHSVPLTRTTEWKPLVSLAAGVRVRLSARLSFAAEFRDYLTPFPREVVEPVGGASVDRWLHDLVPSLALRIRY